MTQISGCLYAEIWKQRLSTGRFHRKKDITSHIRDLGIQLPDGYIASTYYLSPATRAHLNGGISRALGPTLGNWGYDEHPYAVTYSYKNLQHQLIHSEFKVNLKDR